VDILVLAEEDLEEGEEGMKMRLMTTMPSMVPLLLEGD
jgi:hypothetical protein